MSTNKKTGLALVLAACAALLSACGASVQSAKSGPGEPAPSAPPAPPGQAQPAAEASPQAGADGDASFGSAGRGAPATQSAPAGAPAREAAKKEAASDPADRPGLGTQWGETRTSRITTTPFSRNDASNPFAVSSLFYNDEQGARAMANSAGFRRTSAGLVDVANGGIQVGLRDPSTGSFLSGFVAGDKSFIVGEAGNRYTIVIKNRTNARFECIVSVDGLDVLDGKAASFSKRGYLVDPNGEVEIDGFRQSTDSVAAFRFGSVRGSYAQQKHGDSRNVGVIGFAFFNERGSSPFPWTSDEIRRRQDANPFPGQFATPPGR